MLKQTVRALLRLCYRVRVQGMEHDAETGGRTLIVTNPSSLLDALFIASMLPRRMALAVDRRLARRWWMKPVSCSFRRGGGGLFLSDIHACPGARAGAASPLHGLSRQAFSK